MADRGWQTFIYKIRDEYYLSLLPQDIAFQRGLPPQAILGKLIDGPDFFDAGHFAPNPRFIDFLHDVINRHATNCPALLAEARRQQEGNLFIIDGRTPTPAGNLPPQDIIGAVQIHAGAVTGYQGNPNYRPFTTSGLMIPDSWFQSRLLEELEKIVPHAT